MLESYYVRPQAVDRIRASWIGSEIERYVGWLAERSYSPASVRRRVPVLVVVPVDEHAAVLAGVLDGVESCGELGPVLQGLEVGLRVGVVA